jgi:hypothetical protein
LSAKLEDKGNEVVVDLDLKINVSDFPLVPDRSGMQFGGAWCERIP